MNSATSRPAQFRRFTVLDAIILNMATVVGVGVNWLIFFTLFYEKWKPSRVGDLGSYQGVGRYAEWVSVAMVLTMPILAAWTIALVPLGLVPPRPRVDRLACQPGWVASSVFFVALIFNSAMIVGLVLAGILDVDFWLLIPSLIALTILASWLNLILRGRWRPEPTWLDRSGRVLALLWLTLGIVGVVVSYLLNTSRVTVHF
jgi:hypothetical protein